MESPTGVCSASDSKLKRNRFLLILALDNVFISPHISGTRRNVEYLERTNELFCENLRRYLNNEPLYNVVTRERGY